MNELPESWIEITLGDVVNYGKTEKAEPNEIPADAWVLELEDIEKDTSKLLQRQTFAERKSKSTKNRFEAGDVLYGKLRPYLNKVIVADQNGFATTEIIPLKQNDAIHGRYLFYWLKHPRFLDYVETVSHGINMPRLGTDAGLQAPLILAPLNEQKRIAAKLDALLERVDACRTPLERMPLLLKRFRQAVLAAATSGQLTGDWRTARANALGIENTSFIPKVYAPVQIGAFELSTAPPSWRWAKLSTLAKLESGHTPRKSVEDYWENGDVPWICLQDIREAHGKIIQTTKYMPTKLGIDNSSARVLPAGTVCFSRDISVGYTTIMGREMATTQHFANWICGEDLNNKYLMYALMAAKDHLTSSGQGSTVKTIYMPALEDFRIVLPTLNEQREIVRRVETLFAYADRLEARYQQARAEVARLTPALLAKAFRGELVPQDPNDEPAAALLARIQAECATTTTPPRSRSRSAVPATPAKPVAASANGSTAQAVRLPFDAERELAAPTSQTTDDEAGDADDSDDATADTATTNTAKAATNGHRSAPPDIDEFDRETLLATLREVFTPGTRYDANTAIRTVAHTLGYARTGARIHERLKNTLRVAVQRGILVNESGEYRMDSRSIADYTHDECVATLLSALPRAWTEREDAIRASARHLGFRRTGSALRDAFKSAINGAIRRGLLEYDQELIRKIS